MSLDEALRESGAILGRIDGADAPLCFTTIEAEVRAIREATAISALPHVALVRIIGERAVAALDPICPAEVLLRDGAIRHTLLLDEGGRPIADLYLCSDDGDFLLVAEGLSSTELAQHLRDHIPAASGVAIEDLGATHTVLSLNGPFAWEVMAELEGPEITGFPYLTLFHPEPDRTYLRAGKTGEYGYDLIVPREDAGALWRRVLEVGAPLDVIPAGASALALSALENWFFDVRREGRADVGPLELGLAWRVSFDKDFLGSEALRERRRVGIRHRVTALAGDGPMAPGDAVLSGSRNIGVVLNADRSVTIGEHIAVALLEIEYAHSGIDRFAVRHDDEPRRVRTVSPPFVDNRSLVVDPARHTYRDRKSIAFPPANRVLRRGRT